MKINKKFIFNFLYFIFLSVILLIKSGKMEMAFAASWLPLPPTSAIGNLMDPPGSDGVEKFKQLANLIYEYVRYIIGAVATAFLVYAGFMIIISRGEETEVTNQKNNLLWGLIGLAVISIAEFGRDIFRFEEGGWLQNPNAIVVRSQLFNDTVYIVIKYIKYIIGAIAVAYIVRSAYKLLLVGYAEDTVSKEKKNLIGAFLGLVAITMSDTIIKVFYKVDTNNTRPGVKITLNPESGVQEIVGITNFIVNFAGTLAILGLMWGALYYVIALGEDEKMKKGLDIMKYSVIGLIVIYGAFAIVSTVISGSVGNIPVTETLSPT